MRAGYAAIGLLPLFVPSFDFVRPSFSEGRGLEPPTRNRTQTDWHPSRSMCRQNRCSVITPPWGAWLQEGTIVCLAKRLPPIQGDKAFGPHFTAIRLQD